MKTIVTLASASVLALMAAQANAAEYELSGVFTVGGASSVEISLGGANILEAGAYTVGGSMTTDTDTAGYTITGGTVTMTGSVSMNPTGTPITVAMDISGTASSAGVLFNAGSICVTAVTLCDTGFIDVSVENVSFEEGAVWGFFTAAGMQLEGGAGGDSFTVAQPGTIAAPAGPGNAAGAATLLGNAAGIFLGGDIVFTRVAIVPVPAAAWLFGSALVGLAGLGRKRKAS